MKKMQRTVVSLSTRQVEVLQTEADRLGVRVSELLRRIIDQWLETQP